MLPFYDKKFTIKGAIEELKSGHTTKSDSVKMSNKDISVLVEIRNELKSILNELNRHEIYGFLNNTYLCNSILFIIDHY